MATNLRAKEPGRVITGGQAQASNPHIAAKVNASLPRQQKDLVDVFKGWGNKSPNQANPNQNKGLFGKFVDSLDASNVGGVNSPWSNKGFDESKRKGIALKDDLNKLKDFSMINALIQAGKGAADAIGGGIKNVINPPVANKYADWGGRGGMNEGMFTSDFGQGNVAKSYIDPSQVIPTTPSHTGQFAPEMMTGMNPPQHRGIAPPQINHPDAGQWWVNPNTYTPPAPAGGGSINWDYGEGLSRGAGNPDFAKRQGTAEGFYNMHPETSSSTLPKGINYPYNNWLQYQRNLSGMDTSVPLPLMDGNVDTMGSVMNNGGVVHAEAGMMPAMAAAAERAGMTIEEYMSMLANEQMIREYPSKFDQLEGSGIPLNNGGVVHARGGAYVPEVEAFSPQATPAMREDTTKKELASAAAGAAGTAVGGPIGGTIGSTMGSYLFNSGGHVDGPLSLKSQTTTQKLDYS